MRLDPEHNLHPATVAAIFEGLGPEPEAAASISEERLLAFALGLASEAERKGLVRHLIHAPSDRQRLATLVTQLEAGPTWVELALSSMADSFRRVLGSAATRRGWGLSQEGDSGDVPFAQTVLPAAVRNLQNLLAMPRFAETRSPKLLRDGTDPIAWDAEITPDGALVVTYRPPKPLEGVLALTFCDPAGGDIPLAEAEGTASGARFVRPGFAALTGLPTGPLPPDWFEIWGPDDGTDEEEGGDDFRVLATMDDGRIVGLPLGSRPTIRDGRLEVVVHPSEGLLDQFPQGALTLRFRVGTALLTIGTQPLAPAIAFEASLPGMVDVDFRGLSVFEGHLSIERS